MQEGETSKNIEAYQAIKQLIVNQRLSPGQKLIYRDLEEILGMSKTPIINSLMRLEQEGFVVSKKNRGFFMREVSAGEAEQIFDLRERLEVISIEYAVKHRSIEDLGILKEKLIQYQNHQASVYDRRRWELDTAIHMHVATMSKNDYFISMIKTFYDSIYFILNVVHLTPHVGKFNEEHWLLYTSIKDQDITKATEVIRSHIQAAGKLLTSALRV
ncbi:MAG: GntR family transcriptional regulator [Syntrophobacteraceae bacterium]